jgi:hypothetical protein
MAKQFHRSVIFEDKVRCLTDKYFQPIMIFECKTIVEHYKGFDLVSYLYAQHNDIQHNGTPHNGTQHNNTQHNDTQHNDTQHNSIDCRYAECRVF